MSKCNQYRHSHEFTWKQTIATAFFATVPLMGVFNAVLPTHIDASENVSIISPLASPAASLRIVDNASTSAEMSQIDIENYIKTIFGKDAKVAIAVSHNECGPTNKLYPKCNLHTEVENSVGLFQINIESVTTKVHWSRIPGKTLEEKKTWLENPYNNTLLAYWIFQTSGWNPWSAYTSGRYLNDM